MKSILFVLLLSTGLSTLVKPNPNTLSHEEFLGIEVNGIKLQDIQLTNGLVESVTSLFGTPDSTYIRDDGRSHYYAHFYYNGLDFGFAQQRDKNELMGLNITNSAHTVTVQEKTVKIGDSISNLGKVKQNNLTTGGKSILYASDGNETTLLSIRFDQDTKLITEIIYFVLT